MYLLSGITFIYIFSFIRAKKKDPNYQNLLFRSLVIGYVLKHIICLIPYRSSEYAVNLFGYLVVCAIISYALAMLCSSSIMNTILRFLHIRQTTNEGIWYDILGNDTVWLEIKDKESGHTYYGCLCLFEDFNSSPKIVLKQYKEYNSNNIVVDFSNNFAERVMIDTANCNIIKMTYNVDNSIVQEEIKKKEKYLKETEK